MCESLGIKQEQTSYFRKDCGGCEGYDICDVCVGVSERECVQYVCVYI